MTRSWAMHTPLAVLAIAVWPTAALAGQQLSWSSPTPIDHQLPFSQDVSMDDVSCPSASLCVAVDADGNILSSSDPSAGAAAEWTVGKVGDGLKGVSCVSSLCVAVGAHGRLFSSRDAGRGAEARWAAGHAHASREELVGVSCPSASLCVAIATGGDAAGVGHSGILSSSDPGRGAAATWTFSSLDRGNALRGPPQRTARSLMRLTLALRGGRRARERGHRHGGHAQARIEQLTAAGWLVQDAAHSPRSGMTRG
jgi:hypothetical protein